MNMNGTMIIMPKDYFWYFLKDGHVCTLRQQLLSHFLSSFHLVSFLYSKHYTNWHCMRSGALLLHFFLLNSIHHKHSCVQCVVLTHKQQQVDRTVSFLPSILGLWTLLTSLVTWLSSANQGIALVEWKCFFKSWILHRVSALLLFLMQ